MLTRTLRCAIQPETVRQFEHDMAKQRFAVTVGTKFRNGTEYLVEVPVGLANTFADYVKANHGKML